METDLCDKCRKLVKCINEASLPSSVRYGECIYEGLHHTSAVAVHTAAAAGCGLCSKLCEAVECLKIEPTSEFTARAKFHISHQRDPIGGSYYRYYSVGHPRIEFGVHQTGSGSVKIKFRSHPVDEIEYQHDKPEMLPPRYRNASFYYDGHDSTGGDKALALASQWVRNCLMNHQICTGDRDLDFVPPRLLDIRAASICLITDTSNMGKVSYVALSHCWGKGSDQFMKLTANTMDSLRNGVGEDELAQTFRDAIHISRSLGVNYLWIDSLCIIQCGPMGAEHSPEHVEDWQKHVGMMDCIYENCAVNIAAAHGHNPNSGCFVTRNPAGVVPCLVSTTGLSQGYLGDFHKDPPSLFAFVEEKLNQQLESQSVGHSHLDSRGWVAQERLLSPRTIHFSHNQIFWECSEVPLACESFPSGLTTGLGHPNYRWRSYNLADQYEYWLRIVEQYSQRCLTRAEDKLPAIAGVARRVQSILKDDYIAGQFKSHLPKGLLWRRRSGTEYLNPANAARFPTWSWAHSEGPIDCLHFTMDWLYMKNTVVHDIHVELVDPHNVFGQVTSGYIRLRGPTMEISRDDIHEPSKAVDSADSHYFIEPESFRADIQLDFDFNPGSFSWTSVTLLFIGEYEDLNISHAPFQSNLGLILVPAQCHDATTFERVGTFQSFRWEEDQDLQSDPKNYVDLTII
ncbi:HET-domain-containing protein [Hyaloscypha variabilis F]|uniref:HET-domain-containing protein n=1 Tax=Hyaloscypha variabilis (strain UAMH 11265 / GT02V1 / F) TaxID=1149755 RepID=A0A2J6SAC2_HYAVF|nr:HET-domain-containing protein [Hyaloscypha variabilis F]